MISFKLVQLIFPNLYYDFLTPALNKTNLDLLQRIQNAGLRIALGAMRSTPVIALHAEVSVYPMALRIEKMANNFGLKHFTLNSDPIWRELINWSALLRLYPNWIRGLVPPLIKAYRWVKSLREVSMSDRLACYFLKPAEIFDSPEILINGHFNKASADNQQFFLDLVRTNFSHCTEFYTDGSLFHDPVRVGYSLWLGCSAGLHLLTADCRRIISQIKETGDVALVWVSGDKGVFGNEKTDLLAKDGSSEEIRYNKIFFMDCRRINAQLTKIQSQPV
ncbi:hypothetical protein QE152_g17977 [Popillia japonica]|uniref:Uncharacterized protein n=1 Tax=Popillia japonica TaxID=7064 RepID=A0AAW1L171_POPJA